MLYNLSENPWEKFVQITCIYKIYCIFVRFIKDFSYYVIFNTSHSSEIKYILKIG